MFSDQKCRKRFCSFALKRLDLKFHDFSFPEKSNNRGPTITQKLLVKFYDFSKIPIALPLGLKLTESSDTLPEKLIFPVAN